MDGRSCYCLIFFPLYVLLHYAQRSHPFPLPTSVFVRSPSLTLTSPPSRLCRTLQVYIWIRTGNNPLNTVNTPARDNLDDISRGYF